MKFLVTGGTGFLGQRLGQRLLELGHDVTLLGRNQTLGQTLQAQGFRFKAVDLRDRDGMIATCKGQTGVFHCGALSSPWGRYQDFYQTNVLGTQAVVEGCLAHGVERLIHVSTASVYFEFCDRTQIHEQAPLPPRPVNAYAATKRLAENEIQTAHQRGLPVVTIRPRGIFGPGDTALLPRLVRASEQTGIPLIRDGQALTDVTYVDNVVQALLLCQSAPKACLGSVYNITNDQPLALKTLLEMLFQRLTYTFQTRPMHARVAFGIAAALETWARLTGGQEPVFTRYTVGLLSQSQTLNIAAARRDLGYEPRVSLEAGLDQFAQWWKQQSH